MIVNEVLALYYNQKLSRLWTISETMKSISFNLIQLDLRQKLKQNSIPLIQFGQLWLIECTINIFLNNQYYALYVIRFVK